MAKAEFNFGMIKVIIEDEKGDPVAITNLAYNALTNLIPEAKKVVADEKASMLENMKLIKNQAECDCENCEDEEDCEFQHPKKIDEIKNLYV